MPPAKKPANQNVISAIVATVWYPFVSILWLPVTLGISSVYYPSSVFLWILVDLIGDDKWFPREWKKNFAKRPYVKDFVTFASEFRRVLVTFGWPSPPAPPWKCKGCAKVGEIWCVDCKKKLCPQCAYLQHAPGTSTSTHSMEKIIREGDKKREGAHIITPILEEGLFLAVCFYAIAQQTWVQQDYLTTQVTCPVVSRARTIVAMLDSNVFYYFKETLYTWCDIEDSFWRFVTDTWVRSIVMEKDNTLLVLQTLPKALLFDVVLMYTAVPLIAMMYALLANLIYNLELLIPRTETMVKLEGISNALSFFEYFDAGEFSTLPPETTKRFRPSIDMYDAWTYWKQRKSRTLMYYYNSNLSKIQAGAWQLLYVAAIVRICCIWFNVGWILRTIFSGLGLAGRIDLHLLWFGRGVWNELVEETMMWQVGGKFLHFVRAILFKTPPAIYTIYGVWLSGVAVGVVLFSWFCYTIMLQRRAFKKAWAAGEEAKALDFGQPLILQKRS